MKQRHRRRDEWRGLVTEWVDSGESAIESMVQTN